MATQQSRSAARLMIAARGHSAAGLDARPARDDTLFLVQELPAAARWRSGLGSGSTTTFASSRRRPSGRVQATLIIVGGVLFITVVFGVLIRSLAGSADVGPGRCPHPRDRAVLRHADRVGAGVEEHVHGSRERTSRASVEILRGDAGGMAEPGIPALDHHDRLLAMAALRDADPSDGDPVARQRTAGSRRDGRRAVRCHGSASSSCRICRRAITIVVLIQTIFLLSIFAEIFVTTKGSLRHPDADLPDLRPSGA